MTQAPTALPLAAAASESTPGVKIRGDALPSLEQRVIEHERLSNLAKRLIHAVSDERPDALAIDLRSRLSVELVEHLRNGDEICATLASSANPFALDVVIAFVARTASLRESWSAYLAEWDDVRLMSRWHEFAPDTCVVSAKLLEHLVGERATLYPLAFDKGPVPSRKRLGLRHRD